MEVIIFFKIVYFLYCFGKKVLFLFKFHPLKDSSWAISLLLAFGLLGAVAGPVGLEVNFTFVRVGQER